MSKTIAWFSCGCTSAVACKIALETLSDVDIIYIETGSAHVDNIRFLNDCSKWFGHPIKVYRSMRYKNVIDVISKTKCVNNPTGARCTFELKKKVRWQIEDEYKTWQYQIFGFEFQENELKRAKRFVEQYPEAKAKFPLIEKQLTKSDCLAILNRAGIEIPTMYKLGYRNNNCIGCVKGGMGYWNKIRRDFPRTFETMAALERKIGHSCLKKDGAPLYLDSLDPLAGKNESLKIECSLFCNPEFLDL